MNMAFCVHCLLRIYFYVHKFVGRHKTYDIFIFPVPTRSGAHPKTYDMSSHTPVPTTSDINADRPREVCTLICFGLEDHVVAEEGVVFLKYKLNILL